ncbi:MAG: hypothetical protein A2V93_04685 [Ignavibacteria bacterium RBG_16_34_14]|nr:MAG: hypothetical protein A2V93_04685 [Ignavibacteria bacterium RBG_16_34_14]
MFAGCASTKITSFTDPDYKSIQFGKILVVGNTNKLDDRLNLENRLTEIFIANGIKAVTSYSIFPPTREFSDSIKTELMLANEIDGCLMIYFGEIGIQQVQIPIIGSKTTGKIKSTNIKPFTTSTYESKTTYIGGQVLDKPYAEFEIQLFDVINGKMAWIANSFTGGNAYANFNTVYNSFCNKLVEKLAFDKLVQIVIIDKSQSNPLAEELESIDEKIERIYKESIDNRESKIITVVLLNNGETIEGTILNTEYDIWGKLKFMIEDSNGAVHILQAGDVKEIYHK